MSNIALIIEYGLFFFVLGVLVYILTHDSYNG
jgi:hypothetical protein